MKDEKKSEAATTPDSGGAGMDAIALAVVESEDPHAALDAERDNED